MRLPANSYRKIPLVAFIPSDLFHHLLTTHSLQQITSPSLRQVGSQDTADNTSSLLKATGTVIDRNFISFKLQSEANIMEVQSSFSPRTWQQGTNYLNAKSQKLTRFYKKVSLTFNGKTSDDFVPHRLVTSNQKASLWQEFTVTEPPHKYLKLLWT